MTRAEQTRGRLAAAERLEFLLDPGFEALSGKAHGLIAARGTIDGCTLYVHAQNGGVLAASDLEYISDLYDRAISERAPIVALFDAQGYENRPEVLARLGDVLARDARALGVIPKIAIVMGRCTGADALLANASDLLFMVRDQGSLCLAGPEVVAALTQETLSDAALGGAAIHAECGLAAGIYDNECEALLAVRRLLDFLPWAGAGRRSFDDPARSAPSLASLVPDDPTQSYDVKELILKICDKEAFFELCESCAPNIVIGFGRIAGRSIGLIANQPRVLAGALDLKACRKAARFVELCTRFGLPIVSLIDTPGFMPGVAEEHGGIAREGAVLCGALLGAPIRKIAVILRNAIGAAGLAMGVGDNSATIYAWSGARIALTGGMADPSSAVSERRALAAQSIAPAETRARIAEALARTLG